MMQVVPEVGNGRMTRSDPDAGCGSVEGYVSER
jgi:hypothetical protein